MFDFDISFDDDDLLAPSKKFLGAYTVEDIRKYLTEYGKIYNFYQKRIIILNLYRNFE